MALSGRRASLETLHPAQLRSAWVYSSAGGKLLFGTAMAFTTVGAGLFFVIPTTTASVINFSRALSRLEARMKVIARMPFGFPINEEYRR